MDKTADRLANYTHGLRYEHLGEKAIHSVKRSLIDSLGCALAAFHATPIRRLRSLAEKVTSTQGATVIGTDSRISPDLAAFVNGAMARYLDFSDDFFAGTGDIGPHPSDNVCGVLAAAESATKSGRDLILGIVVAYEACGRITEKIAFRGTRPTWDYPILHSISSSLGAAKVLGLSREQIAEALSLAVVPNVCLQQTRSGELSNWKGFAGPNASRNGVFAALLAQAGITGPKNPFEGKSGLMAHLNLSLELEELHPGNSPFKVEGTFYKSMPVRYSAQLPIWVALELRATIDCRDIESIQVFVARRYATKRENDPEFWDPMSRETADHSFSFLIAAALTDGEISEKTFSSGRFRDPSILDLMGKISLAEDPSYSSSFPATFNCRFETTLKSGQRISLHRTNPKGHPANPMSDNDIESKFLAQAAVGTLTQPRSRALLDKIWRLEEISDLGDFLRTMQLTKD